MTSLPLLTRRLATALVVTAIACPLGLLSQGRVERTFDADRPGSAPEGFLFGQMKGVVPGRWVVQRAGQEAFLAQLGEPSRDDGVVLALIDGAASAHEDVRVSVKLRLAGGGRSAGVVWRYLDAENFYLASLNLARQRIDVVRIAQGNRVRIRNKGDLSLDPAAWHTLTVVHEQNEIRLYLGGIRVFEFWDRALRHAGRAGVWSAADTVAHFDELRVQPEEDDHETPRRRGRE